MRFALIRHGAGRQGLLCCCHFVKREERITFLIARAKRFRSLQVFRIRKSVLSVPGFSFIVQSLLFLCSHHLIELC